MAVRPSKDLAMAIMRLQRVVDGEVAVMAYGKGSYNGHIAGDIAAVLRALEQRQPGDPTMAQAGE